jgi:hypothetical protein
VDVGKAELTLCLVWPDRAFERPWRIKSPGQIRLVVGRLLELNQLCPVTVAMESSGTYGDAFRQALEDAGLPMHRVSGKAVKDDSEGFDGGHGGKAATGIMRRLAAAAWHAGQGEVFDPRRLFRGTGRVVAS